MTSDNEAQSGSGHEGLGGKKPERNLKKDMGSLVDVLYFHARTAERGQPDQKEGDVINRGSQLYEAKN